MMYLNSGFNISAVTAQSGLTVTYDVFKYKSWPKNPNSCTCLTVTYDVFK